jgi:hypothetical protein
MIKIQQIVKNNHQVTNNQPVMNNQQVMNNLQVTNHQQIKIINSLQEEPKNNNTNLKEELLCPS